MLLECVSILKSCVVPDKDNENLAGAGFSKYESSVIQMGMRKPVSSGMRYTNLFASRRRMTRYVILASRLYARIAVF